jgi:hypothetical protein
MSQFANPAQLTATQDTGDDPQYTNSPYDMCQASSNGNAAQYQAACKAEEFRHNGAWCFGFVDGHAKGVHVGMFANPADGNNFEIMPLSQQDMLGDCYDPSATLEIPAGHFGGYEDVNNCTNLVQEIMQQRVAINP